VALKDFGSKLKYAGNSNWNFNVFDQKCFLFYNMFVKCELNSHELSLKTKKSIDSKSLLDGNLIR
jgi:hypothetical protein